MDSWKNGTGCTFVCAFWQRSIIAWRQFHSGQFTKLQFYRGNFGKEQFCNKQTYPNLASYKISPCKIAYHDKLFLNLRYCSLTTPRILLFVLIWIFLDTLFNVFKLGWFTTPTVGISFSTIFTSEKFKSLIKSSSFLN